MEAAIAPINGQGSLFSIIYQGGWLSLLVLVVLLIMSVISWAVILRKWILFTRLAAGARKFSKNINLSNELSDIILRSEQYSNSYTARLFQAAYLAYSEQITLRKAEKDSFDRQRCSQKIERHIDKAIISEKTTMEKELGLLATISSSAPFIGLLGTVTGIIDAFYSIAAQGASSIAVVAPGISAALVATAVGLFTAIPALIGYNIFREKTRALSNDLNGFGLDLLTLLDRSIDDNTVDTDDIFPEIKLGSKKN